MIPTVALVGRPNVGKSTLFNRLTGKRKALTHDVPGVTRDRVIGEVRRPRGGVVYLVDTGGFDPDTRASIPVMVREQAFVAVEQATVVILVVDGVQGLVPADRELAEVLRRSGKPTIVLVNKADRREARFAASDFVSLGFPTLEISAEHGLGLEKFWEQLEALLPPPESVDLPPPELAVAIVGRPNVGKSSLLNRILGEQRVLVSEIPGTTRDAVDTPVTFRGRRLLLVDTAGIRRKGRTEQGVEVLSVVMARKAIERAHVCLLVVDGSAGVTAQDTHVAGLIQEAGKGVLVVVNKSDQVERENQKKLLEDVEFRLKFLKQTPCVFVSALTGFGIPKLIPQVLAVGDNFLRRFGTGELNRVLRSAWETHPPPGGKKPAKLYYATQVGTGPPRFKLFTNLQGELHFSYLRFLENAIRQAFPLAGVPVRFIIVGKP